MLNVNGGLVIAQVLAVVAEEVWVRLVDYFFDAGEVFGRFASSYSFNGIAKVR